MIADFKFPASPLTQLQFDIADDLKDIAEGLAVLATMGAIYNDHTPACGQRVDAFDAAELARHAITLGGVPFRLELYAPTMMPSRSSARISQTWESLIKESKELVEFMVELIEDTMVNGCMNEEMLNHLVESCESMVTRLVITAKQAVLPRA